MAMAGLLDIVCELRDRIQRAEEDAKESGAAARNSYGAGWDRGYADALQQLLSDITEKPE